MFINLTNHKSDGWSPEQRAAAEAMGGNIVDVPFPNIDPSASLEDVARLSKEYFERIAQDDPDVVHIAGEMTFVYTFVSLCREAGIPCVAATSERISTQNADGTKTVAFQFAQFRPYF